MVSLCSPGYSETHWVWPWTQRFTCVCLPALGLKACTATPWKILKVYVFFVVVVDAQLFCLWSLMNFKQVVLLAAFWENSLAWWLILSYSSISLRAEELWRLENMRSLWVINVRQHAGDVNSNGLNKRKQTFTQHFLLLLSGIDANKEVVNVLDFVHEPQAHTG